MIESSLASPVLSERNGSVLLVTLNRPHVSNALDAEALRILSQIWREAADPGVRAVVLTGAGRNFCAGADLAEAVRNPEALELRRAFHPQYLAMAALKKPVIAAVNGAAAGGGLGIALAADIRILSNSARLVPGWVEIGLVPDLGASWFAPRMIGEARAFEWFASGRPVMAAEALALGLATSIVEPETLVEYSLNKALQLASQPGLAVGLTKQLLVSARNNGLADQLEAEILAQSLAHLAPDRAGQVAERMAGFQRPVGATLGRPLQRDDDVA